MLEQVTRLSESRTRVLAVDIPTGLSADTGQGDSVRASHTLSLLGLKPGLFTGRGRDAAGEVWLDDLGVDIGGDDASAVLSGPPAFVPRAHASHKGSFGDVAVIGGAPGMAGAALLAASAALHAGAGRVFVGVLDASLPGLDANQPELMLRAWDTLDLASMAVVAGCGGGDAIRAVLPRVIASARELVLDADALNAIAADAQLQSLLRSRGRRGKPTVITPHPLEAGRIIETNAANIQADRLGAARSLSEKFECVTVLKGSGTVVMAPGHLLAINFTGNARLATAGTGDVLAGVIGARLARGEEAFQAACAAVHAHGAAADAWEDGQALTASALARLL